MNINKKCRLFLQDLYLYDITACHYNLLKNLGYDMSGFDANNKLERNIAIGKLMRNNSNLISALRTITGKTIDKYIEKNSINTETELITRQYDGIIITRKMKDLDLSITPLTLKETYKIFIISYDRTRYIATTNTNETIIKGVSYRYELMEQMLKKILNINFVSKAGVFKELETIKMNFYNSTNPYLFGIPVEGKNTFLVFLKALDQIEITSSAMRFMDTEDIDKKKYYDLYLKPFINSIVSTFI